MGEWSVLRGRLASSAGGRRASLDSDARFPSTRALGAACNAVGIKGEPSWCIVKMQDRCARSRPLFRVPAGDRSLGISEVCRRTSSTHCLKKLHFDPLCYSFGLKWLSYAEIPELTPTKARPSKSICVSSW